MELMSEYRTCLQGTDGLKRWTSDAGDTPAPLIFYIIFIFFKITKLRVLVGQKLHPL